MVEDSNGKLIYISTPFTTIARRKENITQKKKKENNILIKKKNQFQNI